MPDPIPFIGIPTVERRSFKNRFAVQEFYEEITYNVNDRHEKLSIPETAIICFPEKDFAWFLGAGTLPVILPKCKFIEGSLESELIQIRHMGQCEYAVKPGIIHRLPTLFYYLALAYQYFIFLAISPEEVGGGDSNVFLNLEQDIQNSAFDTAISLSDDFETLGFYDESGIFFSGTSYLFIGTSDENQRFFSETSYLFIGTSDENQRFTSSADPLFL